MVSALVAIGTAALKMFKYQENWINYRTTCETLQKEITSTRAPVDYRDVEDSHAQFVERVEAPVSHENTLWLSAQAKTEE